MDLSIVILNYNGKHWLKQLLPSLREHFLMHTKYSVEVVVVDNASTDGSQAWIAQQPDIRLICSDRNLGFAAGNNLALRTNTARYVMLLNNDTELLPDGMSNLDMLLDYMDEEPSIGALTPHVRLDDGTIDPACHRGEPTLWASFTYLSKLERLFPQFASFGRYHLTHLRTNTIHDIEACTGAAMIVPGSVLQEVGLLDEQFFMYAEDLDWCRRMREYGLRVIYHPGATIVHHKHRSGLKHEDKEHKNQTRKWFYDTMLQYYDKHYRTQYPAPVRSLLRLMLACMKRFRS